MWAGVGGGGGIMSYQKDVLPFIFGLLLAVLKVGYIEFKTESTVIQAIHQRRVSKSRVCFAFFCKTKCRAAVVQIVSH